MAMAAVAPAQDVALIDACDEMLQRDVAKYSEMVTHWSSEAPGTEGTTVGRPGTGGVVD